MSQNKILAIDPGTRQIGVAFLEDEILIYHEVKPIKERKSPYDILTEGREIILRLISDFRPQALALEKAFFANTSNAALLNVFVDEIRVIGKKKRLKVLSFAPTKVRMLLCGDGTASKQDVAKVVMIRYPELRVYLSQESEWKERYWYNIFDAVAVGIVAHENI